MNDFRDHSPYQSPQYPAEYALGHQGPAKTPGVWTWYIVYCVCMALLYLAVVALGAAFVAFPAEFAEDQDEVIASTIAGSMFLVIGGVLLLIYAVAPFLPKSKAAWIYGFVTIGIGMTSACTLPFCIALLIFWLKPETKAFFRVA